MRALRWPRTPAAARAVQNDLRERLRIEGGPSGVKLVAGADLAYAPDDGRLFAVVAVFTFPEMVLHEQRRVERPIQFPYVPGLLSFRELPAILAAWRRLESRPDLVLCDGHGIAHPRAFGLASHLGLILGLPSIGCAKSRLVGVHEAVGTRQGDRKPLRVGGRTLGTVIRSRAGANPIYISPGHLIGMRQAVRWALRCCRGFRLPEPVRQADRIAGAMRRSFSAGPGG